MCPTLVQCALLPGPLLLLCFNWQESETEQSLRHSWSMGLWAHGLIWSLGSSLYSTSNCKVLRVKITVTIKCLIKSQETKPFIIDFSVPIKAD